MLILNVPRYFHSLVPGVTIQKIVSSNTPDASLLPPRPTGSIVVKARSYYLHAHYQNLTLLDLIYVANYLIGKTIKQLGSETNNKSPRFSTKIWFILLVQFGQKKLQ